MHLRLLKKGVRGGGGRETRPWPSSLLYCMPTHPLDFSWIALLFHFFKLFLCLFEKSLRMCSGLQRNLYCSKAISSKESRKIISPLPFRKKPSRFSTSGLACYPHLVNITSISEITNSVDIKWVLTLTDRAVVCTIHEGEVLHL